MPPDLSPAWLVFNDLPVPAVAHDLTPEARVRFMNAAFTEAFGYTCDDLPTVHAWAERAYPDPAYRADAASVWWAAIAARQAGGAMPPPAEYRIVDKAGHPREVLIGFALHGTVALVTFQDITAMRAAERALDAECRKTARTVHALTENMPGGAYTMLLRPGETMAQFAFLSERFLRMLDLTRDEAVGDPATGFSRVHPDDRADWIALNAAAFTDRAPFSGETRVVVRGETRWVRAESVPRQLDDGATIWEGLLVDITRLKEAEQQLRTVLAAARAHTWRRDIVRQRSEFDECWARIEGLPQGQMSLSCEEWIATVHPDDAPRVAAQVAALQSGVADRDTLTYRRRLRDDRWLWLRVHAGVSERDPSGRPTALSGVSFDITDEVTKRQRELEERAALREDLQRAQQRDTVAQVAGGVAHDLNNLIGLAMWTLESLEPECDALPEIRDGLARIRRAVDMARDLIAGLGGLVRPDAPRGAHDLRDLAMAALDLLGRRRIARHDVRLTLPDRELPVWANPTQVVQVMVNLALNGCESDPGGVATVAIRVEPPDAPLPRRPPDAGTAPAAGRGLSVFSVADTGAGIPADVRARLFQRNHTTKGAQGTGLGLLIVASILQENRAALWVETALGQGTTMTVAWPQAPASPAAASRFDLHPPPGAEADDDPPRLDGMRALVVDDLPDVANVLAAMLERAGATVTTETDPARAAALLAEGGRDWSVLVTDLHMPGMDGTALARNAALRDPPVPAILVTARPDTLAEPGRRDFAAVLSKPVSGAGLAAAVHRAIAASARPRPGGRSG